jgi:hypothetical protein
MKIAKLAALIAVAIASVSFAQEFDGINLLNVQSTTAAAPQAPSGQGAPGAYYGSNVWWQPRDPYQDYYRQAYEHRYENVRRGLRQMASQYGWGSNYAAYYNQQAAYGEDLWVRYLRHRDQASLWALSQWIGQWEGQLAWGGGYYQNGGGYYNNGGWYSNGGYYSCTCAYNRYSCSSHPYYSNGGGWGGTYSHGCTCYYNSYSCAQHRVYYPQHSSWGYPVYANDNYISGLQIGNGIGHIVHGGRRGNDFETVGGVLSTAGGIINIINNARR